MKQWYDNPIEYLGELLKKLRTEARDEWIRNSKIFVAKSREVRKLSDEVSGLEETLEERDRLISQQKSKLSDQDRLIRDMSRAYQEGYKGISAALRAYGKVAPTNLVFTNPIYLILVAGEEVGKTLGSSNLEQRYFYEFFACEEDISKKALKSDECEDEGVVLPVALKNLLFRPLRRGARVHIQRVYQEDGVGNVYAVRKPSYNESFFGSDVKYDRLKAQIRKTEEWARQRGIDFKFNVNLDSEEHSEDIDK